MIRRGSGNPKGSAPVDRGGATMIRVLLVDDQALVRAGFRSLLDAEEVELVHNHHNFAAGRPGRRRPGVRADPHHLRLDEYVFYALRAGACGFLLKHTSPEGLVEAVRTIASGEG